MSSVLTKFADGTKIIYYGEALYVLSERATMWKVKFIVGKCEAMHTWIIPPPQFKYMLMGSGMAEIKAEKSWDCS